MMWNVWWVWIVAGFALGVLEILAPGYIFLGFAMGALLTGVLLGVGVLGGSLPLLLLVIASSSSSSATSPTAAAAEKFIYARFSSSRPCRQVVIIVIQHH